MFSLPRLRNFFVVGSCLLTSILLLAGCTLPFQKEEVSGLQVTSNGINAAVFLNGNKVGTTPYSDQTLKPGNYTLRLVPEDSSLAAYETTVTLYPTTLAVMNWTFGQTTETSGGIIYELVPLKKKKEAHLSIASIPDGSIVKVDDVSQGFTPVLMKSMTAGTHQFMVSLPSYKDQEDSINIAEGFQMDVTVKLAKIKTPVLPDDQEATDSAQASRSASLAGETSNVASSSATNRSSQTTSTGKTATILDTGTGWLRVRDSSSSSGKELAKVDVGKTFPLVDSKDGWDQIEYEKGKKGWVSSKYVKTN